MGIFHEGELEAFEKLWESRVEAASLATFDLTMGESTLQMSLKYS